jgi:hypothetical protein
MEANNFRIAVYVVITLRFWVGTFTSFAAAQTSSLLKAKKEAELGDIFSSPAMMT